MSIMGSYFSFALFVSLFFFLFFYFLFFFFFQSFSWDEICLLCIFVVITSDHILINENKTDHAFTIKFVSNKHTKTLMLSYNILAYNTRN
jgi:hypothetical protein